MKEYEFGVIVRSMAGHDAGHHYIVVKEDAAYVYLSDGKIRTIEHPKKKKKKHVQRKNGAVAALKEAMERHGRVTDEQIKYALKQYKSETEQR